MFGINNGKQKIYGKKMPSFKFPEKYWLCAVDFVKHNNLCFFLKTGHEHNQVSKNLLPLIVRDVILDEYCPIALGCLDPI